MKYKIGLFFVFICLFSFCYAENCTSPGLVEYKYTASGCDTITNKRTCCQNGSWSDYNTDCPVAVECSASAKPAESLNTAYSCAKQTRSVTCNYSTGEWEVGEWSSLPPSYECYPGTMNYYGGWCDSERRYFKYRCSTSCKWVESCPVSKYVKQQELAIDANIPSRNQDAKTADSQCQGSYFPPNRGYTSGIICPSGTTSCNSGTYCYEYVTSRDTSSSHKCVWNQYKCIMQ